MEANTVRLKEHGEDVLVLEKIPVYQPADVAKSVPASAVANQHRYSGIAKGEGGGGFKLVHDSISHRFRLAT